jgi:cytochrome bd-type quinol oxidase subunit 2
MLKKIKQILLQSSVMALFLVPAFGLVTVGAQGDPDVQGSLCDGAEDLQFGGGDDCGAVGDEAQGQVNSLITDVINIFSVIVGVIAVIMIIIGGFRYIVSGGDSGNVTNAKNTILYALIGLVIVAFAQFVVKFILGRITEGS